MPRAFPACSPASIAISARRADPEVSSNVPADVRGNHFAVRMRRPHDSGTDPLPKSLTHVQRTHFTPCFPARRITRASRARRPDEKRGEGTTVRCCALPSSFGAKAGNGISAGVSSLPLLTSRPLSSSLDAPFWDILGMRCRNSDTHPVRTVQRGM